MKPNGPAGGGEGPRAPSPSQKQILASKTERTDTNSLIKGKWDLQFYFTLKCNNGFRMNVLEVELLINDKTIFIK